MKQIKAHSLIKKLSESHFGDVTAEVLSKLEKGQNCAVYGLPGYGMEFFAKHIAALILQKDQNLEIILINTELEGDPIKRVKEAYSPNKKVLVILAEVLHPQHEGLFKFLNYCKWESKDTFTVLTIANFTLLSEYNTYLNYAADIFHPRISIPVFDYEGIKKIIELNNNEYNWDTSVKHYKRIFELSGGNPALTKYICMAMYEEGEEVLQDLSRLVKIQPLNRRIEDFLQMLVFLNISQQQKIGFLDGAKKIVPKLIEFYIAHIDPCEISIMFPNLTKNERKILKFMLQSPGIIINKDQIALILGQDLETYSEWAIYKAMQRFKDKVSGTMFVKTVRGRGWVLEEQFVKK